MNAADALRFPIHVVAADEAVLHALRGIANYAEQSQYKMSSVKGASWSPGGRATFHFSREAFRDRFRTEATRLLSEHWSERPDVQANIATTVIVRSTDMLAPDPFADGAVIDGEAMEV